MVSLRALFRRHKVASVNVLALDCEGHDCTILSGLLRVCKKHPEWLPRVILFETNGMNDKVFGSGTEARIINAFRDVGYRLLYGGGFRATCGVRDTVLVLDRWPVNHSHHKNWSKT